MSALLTATVRSARRLRVHRHRRPARGRLRDPRRPPAAEPHRRLRLGPRAAKGPDRLSKGATFGVDMKLFGFPYKIRNTVVEFEEDRRVAWRHFGGHRWRYVLEPIDGRAPG